METIARKAEKINGRGVFIVIAGEFCLILLASISFGNYRYLMLVFDDVKVPSFPDDVAMALIEEELGKPWHEIYSELSPSPIAAGWCNYNCLHYDLIRFRVL